MLKKMALVFLGLNLLTSKPVVASDNYRAHQQEVRFRQQFARESYAAYQRFLIDEQRLDWDKQRRKRQSQEATRWVPYHENQAKVALAKAELKKVEAETEKLKAENAFRKCLISNIHNSDLGSSRIPKVCEDSARVLRLLGGGFKVDALIEAFQK